MDITPAMFVSLIPGVAIVLIWINNALKNKNVPYWLILFVVNSMWIVFCLYAINVDSSVIDTGLTLVVIDNIVCIGISIYGLIRLLKGKKNIGGSENDKESEFKGAGSSSCCDLPWKEEPVNGEDG